MRLLKFSLMTLKDIRPDGSEMAGEKTVSQGTRLQWEAESSATFFCFLFFFYNPHQYLSLFCVSMLPGVKKMLTIKILATLSGGKGELSSYLSEIKYEISVYYVNSFKPKISLVILLTICHTILIVSVGRIWYWIN